MKARWLAMLAIVAGCASVGLKPAQHPLRVMTYNIEYGHEGLDSVAAVIRDQHPDIVGLQEVDVHWSARSNFVDQAAALSKATGMNYRFARIYSLPNADPSKPPREFGVALLSRYPIVAFANRETMRHSTQDSLAAPAPMPGLLEATVDVNGEKIRVFNVHLDYRSDPSVRRMQISDILRLVVRDTSLTILTGDLNAGPDAPELKPLFDWLHDSWQPSRGEGPTYSATKPEKRIDYVLISRWFCTTRSVVPKVFASDHFPMVVDLNFDRTCQTVKATF